MTTWMRRPDTVTSEVFETHRAIRLSSRCGGEQGYCGGWTCAKRRVRRVDPGWCRRGDKEDLDHIVEALKMFDVGISHKPVTKSGKTPTV